MKLTITLPHTNKLLSPNGGHGNRYAVAAAKKEARQLAKFKTIQELQRLGITPPIHPNRYKLTLYYKGCKPDDDNALARCKAYKDGICDAMLTNDKDMSCCGIELVRDFPRAGFLELSFWAEDTP